MRSRTVPELLLVAAGNAILAPVNACGAVIGNFRLKQLKASLRKFVCSPGQASRQ